MGKIGTFTRRMLSHMLKYSAALSVFVFIIVVTVSGAQPTGGDFTEIDAYLASQMQLLNVPGLALGIVSGDEVVYVKGYGVANPAGQPVTPEIPFRLASVTKTLTAAAVMQLVERGELVLEAPVNRYLPDHDFFTREPQSAITVRDLLYHTSGIPNYAGYDNLFNGDMRDSALEENVHQLERIALNRDVGASYQYSNLNYDVLGLLIEKVSGQSYEAYMQEQVFTPLGMTDSYTSQEEAQAAGMATGYRQWFGFPFAADLPDDRAARPSSFLIASVEDMTHFLIAMLNGGQYEGAALLSEESVSAMLEARISIGETGRRSGMGLEISTLEGIEIAAKTGGTANYNARIVLAPENKVGVVVLMNSFDIGLNSPFDAVANNVMTWVVNGQAPEPVSKPFGGGNAVMKLGMIVILILEAVMILRTRWMPDVERSTQGWIARHLLLPLVLDALIGVVVFFVIPQLINTPAGFMYYFSPDIFWLSVAIFVLPLAKDLIRAVFILRKRRSASSLRSAHAQA